jgi:hypothetical protein
MNSKRLTTNVPLPKEKDPAQETKTQGLKEPIEKMNLVLKEIRGI